MYIFFSFFFCCFCFYILNIQKKFLRGGKNIKKYIKKNEKKKKNEKIEKQKK